MSERFINPYTDYGFKKLFGTEENKELLISFLNAMIFNKDGINDIHNDSGGESDNQSEQADRADWQFVNHAVLQTVFNLACSANRRRPSFQRGRCFTFP